MRKIIHGSLSDLPLWQKVLAMIAVALCVACAIVFLSVMVERLEAPQAALPRAPANGPPSGLVS